jgi:hypothetical protein
VADVFFSGRLWQGTKERRSQRLTFPSFWACCVNGRLKRQQALRTGRLTHKAYSPKGRGWKKEGKNEQPTCRYFDNRDACAQSLFMYHRLRVAAGLLSAIGEGKK